MYAGHVVELADATTLLTEPRHPYTSRCCARCPTPSSRTRYLPSIAGTPPQLVDVPPGCRFAPRCPLVPQQCQPRTSS